MDITALYQIFLGCTGITTDSRNCPEGSLFIALKGDTFNGNAFAAKALEAGSAYAVVDEAAYAPAGQSGCPSYRLPNPAHRFRGKADGLEWP